jgi:hypothetical protein
LTPLGIYRSDAQFRGGSDRKSNDRAEARYLLKANKYPKIFEPKPLWKSSNLGLL